MDVLGDHLLPYAIIDALGTLCNLEMVAQKCGTDVDLQSPPNAWLKLPTLALALDIPALSDNLQPVQEHGRAGRLAFSWTRYTSWRRV